MRFRPLCVSLLALAVAAPTAGAQESTPTSPEVDVLLGLQRGDGALSRYVRQASDPRSANYRRFLTPRQISRAFGANPNSRKAVVAWLGRRGIRASADPMGAFVTAHATRAQAARVFGATASAAGAGTSPRVPAGLRGLVEGVAAPAASPRPEPLVRNVRGANSRRTGTARGCAAGRASTGFTPNQMATAYGFDRLHRRGLTGRGRRIALIEVGVGLNRGDLRTFAACFGKRVPPVRSIPVGQGKPSPREAENSSEAALDLQVLAGLAPGLAGIDYLDMSPKSSFGMGVAAALSPRRGKRVPDVISVSYGFCEPAMTQTTQRRIDRFMFEAAAAAGSSVLIASGDDGSSGCARENVPRPALVEYPASHAPVTAVGGTSFTLTRGNRIQTERTWNDLVFALDPPVRGGGGGGVSQQSRLPWYQRQAGLRGKGRQVPDLSFYASNLPGYAFYCTLARCQTGGWSVVGGTSAATPLFAAGVALANQAAKRRRQPRLGFVNPLLYQLSRSRARTPFRDVRIGTNDVFGVGCCRAGAGYDQATGLGSLNVADLAVQAGRAYRRSRR